MNITLLKHLSDFIEKILNSFGFTATFNYLPSGSDYEVIAPMATYAPWRNDDVFVELFNKIRKFTYVDKYRCYELWQLVGEVSKIPGALIEVGVWRGGTGAIISKKAELCGIKDTIYLCDTFEGVVKADSQKDPYFHGGELNDTSVKIVRDLIYRRLKLKNVKILKGVFPDETKELIKDDKFRFCHIDVDVYQSAKDIVEWIWDKISLGGVIIYDDYGFQGCEGITKFVEEERKKSDRLVIYNLNGHAIVVKLS